MMVSRGDDHSLDVVFRFPLINFLIHFFSYLFSCRLLLLITANLLSVILVCRCVDFLSEIGAQYGPQVPHIPDDPFSIEVTAFLFSYFHLIW